MGAHPLAPPARLWPRPGRAPQAALGVEATCLTGAQVGTLLMPSSGSLSSLPRAGHIGRQST